MIFRRREQAVIEIRRLALTQLPLRDRRIERIEGTRIEDGRGFCGAGRSCGRSSFWKKFQRIRCETKPPRCSAIRSPCSRYPSMPVRSIVPIPFPIISHNRSNPSHIRSRCFAYYVADRFVRPAFFPLSFVPPIARAMQQRWRPAVAAILYGNDGWTDGTRGRFRREWRTRPPLPPIALATRVTRHRISAGRLETTIAGQGGRPSSTCHNSIESLLCPSPLLSLSPS